MKLATLCYVQRGNQVLMLHRIKKANDIHQGKWNGLGGKLEPGESPERCVIREVREESGLEISQPQYRGLLVFVDFKEEDWYVWVYTASRFAGELTESAEGALAWVDADKITSLPLWESDHVFLPWLQQPGVFSARFVYRGETMQSYEVSFYPPP
jgi:8-oxo-dGTP diphosphatase